MNTPDWKEIASHLYDELRLRGAECLFNHKEMCGCNVLNCLEEFEKADAKDSNNG
jgi:hypothetical protein